MANLAKTLLFDCKKGKIIIVHTYITLRVHNMRDINHSILHFKIIKRPLQLVRVHAVRRDFLKAQGEHSCRTRLLQRRTKLQRWRLRPPCRRRRRRWQW